ncbi:MAG: DMT family transporter [Acidimicrobiia bacterium]
MTGRPDRIITTADGTRPESFGPSEWSMVASLALMWGASFLFIDIGLDAFEPGLITWLRVSLGAVAIGLLPGARAPVDARAWPRLILLGFTWIAIPFTLFPIAQQWIDSSLAGILNAAMPLFAAVIAAVLLRRLPGSIIIGGLLVGFFGVVLVSLSSGAGESAALGIILVLAATVLYGFSTNIAVPLQQSYGALPVIWRVQLIAAAATLPLGVLSVSRSSFEMQSAVAVAVLGVFGTGVALAIMTQLIGRVGATRGALAIYLVPVVATILGVAFRDDEVGPLTLIGMVLVLLGAYLASRKESTGKHRSQG